MSAEELVLIAEVFHTVCIFRKEDLVKIDAKGISGEIPIALKPNNDIVIIIGFSVEAIRCYPASLILR